MVMTDPNDDMLEALFAEARGASVAPDDALTARVLADAARVQAAGWARPEVPQPGLWQRFLDMIGGWPALGGLATATVAGFWIGVAPPTSVSDLTASLIGDEVSLSPLGLQDDLFFTDAEGQSDG